MNDYIENMISGMEYSLGKIWKFIKDNLWENFVDLLYRIKWKISNCIDDAKWRLQRVFRGYADIDVWNFDNRLMELVARHVKVLKETTHGYPASLTAEKWDEILGDIVFAAEMYTSDTPELCYADSIEQYNMYKDIHNKVYCDKDDPKFPSEDDWKRAIRGIEYFKEYMFCLWD